MSRQLTELLDAVRTLALPDPETGGGSSFAALPYPGSPRHRIGKNAAGHVAFLLSLDPAGQDPLPPVALEHLSVLHAARCRIRDAGGRLESGVYTVIECTSNDRPLVTYFITLISSLVFSLPERPTCHAAAAAIRQMIRLFQAMKRPSTRSVQGLWAELFVIKRSRNPREMVRAWHADPFEQFDFAEFDDRLEVKSTSRATRSHLFSLAQLRPIGAIRSVIASVKVVRNTNGLKLSHLWHSVRSLVDDDGALLARVDHVVTTSLGRSWRRALSVAFDEQVASSQTEFYDANDIPCIDPQLPAGISEVHFRADLTDAVPIAVELLQTLGAFYNSASTYH